MYFSLHSQTVELTNLVTILSSHQLSIQSLSRGWIPLVADASLVVWSFEREPRVPLFVSYLSPFPASCFAQPTGTTYNPLSLFGITCPILVIVFSISILPVPACLLVIPSYLHPSLCCGWMKLLK